jgi:sugar phosphate isomerase/epimerase
MAQLSRRELLAAAVASAQLTKAATTDHGFTLCAFSKHFQWTDVKGAAETMRGLGYDGVDLTLRKGGHVLPERVQDDLPKAAGIIKKAGLKFPMVTTDIVDTGSPYAEPVMKTLASLGIKRYRWGGFRYDLKRSIPDQLAEFKTRVKDLAAMNKQYGLCAMYHTHSGVGQVGASMWDLYLLLKDFDTDSVSANYDIGHATVEGGLGGWIHSSRLLLPYMKGVAVKDFFWKKNEKDMWSPRWCPLGDGMVDFKQFLPMLKQAGFSGPLQLHMEYPELGTAATGKTESSLPKDKLLSLMRHDITKLKELLHGAGMV